MIEAVDDVMVHTSGAGTKRNRLEAHGTSGAEGRPAVSSIWRRQLPLTPSRPLPGDESAAPQRVCAARYDVGPIRLNSGSTAAEDSVAVQTIKLGAR
jgi:hypothetical protein